jgi:hypothetical protein
VSARSLGVLGVVESFGAQDLVRGAGHLDPDEAAVGVEVEHEGVERVGSVSSVGSSSIEFSTMPGWGSAR